ncbi:MAG: ribosome-binding factor A [Bacteriovoracales bacterium]|nr:ribosome-binding factor A [Bacteriovoracales bacterium]
MNRSEGFSRHKKEAKILDDLNSFLRFYVNDPRLRFVSITRVDLNKDQSMAKVYWDTFDSEKSGEARKAMGGASGKLRTLLAKAMGSKTVPDLRVERDGQFTEEKRITELLCET